MGYESKIYFVRDYGVGNKNGLTDSTTVAMIDMGKMGYKGEIEKFKKLFDVETPFNLYVVDYDELTGCENYMAVYEDKYGDRLKFAQIDDLIKQIDKVIKEVPDYIRFKQLKGMLKAFKDDPEIYVVHYGY